MGIATIDHTGVAALLRGLLGKNVRAVDVPAVEPHPATLRGLVTDNNDLVAVIGSDLQFAHLAGACLAMMPKGRALDAGNEPDETLIEVFTEVANVFSRLVNEASARRLRLDPSLDHSTDELLQVVSSGAVVVSTKVDIDNYGAGNIAVWMLAAG